jgi:hypothetical protein
MYQSLFEYLGKPAGPELGKQVYAEAKKRRVKVSPRQVNTKKYKGTILTYPVSFLDNYFARTLSINSFYYNPCAEVTLSNSTPTITSPQKKSPLENLY